MTGPAMTDTPFYTVNEYGTEVTAITCRECGDRFTVCPAVPLDEVVTRGWDVCLAPECPSYDITRDISLGFEDAVAAGWIEKEENFS